MALGSRHRCAQIDAKTVREARDSDDDDICDIPVINVKVVELGSQRVPSESVPGRPDFPPPARGRN